MTNIRIRNSAYYYLRSFMRRRRRGIIPKTTPAILLTAKGLSEYHTDMNAIDLCEVVRYILRL